MFKRTEKEVLVKGSMLSYAKDDEIEALRLQLQRLERRLQERDKVIEELSGSNCHHKEDRDDDSYDSYGSRHRKFGRYKEKCQYEGESYNCYSPKVDILKFEGKSNVDDFLDWLNTVECVFEFYDPLEHK